MLNVHVVPGLEVLVGGATDKFDVEGRLIHEPTRDALGKALTALGHLATTTAHFAKLRASPPSGRSA